MPAASRWARSSPAAACAGAEEAAAYGADAILKAEGPSLAAYSSDGYATVLADAVKAKGATVLLAAATSTGKDVAPRVAARLGAGYAADVTGLAMEDGKLQAAAPRLCGQGLRHRGLRERHPGRHHPSQCLRRAAVPQGRRRGSPARRRRRTSRPS